ncbi:MAG: phosphate/phosphite/phosphonate ABC transporter substrate-binding protein [Candidatus Omnitrophica bacterium]|nr:phosphate/phosphite/phosphonate ABC transporter substrate-binding protein [Candidatus Omnitrophota bacterium]
MKQRIYKIMGMAAIVAAGLAGPVSAEEVTFAMLPQMSDEATRVCWEGILKHVEQESGIQIRQVFPKNFDEHVRLCREGRIDFAYSNPFTYVQMVPAHRTGVEGHRALAVAVQEHGKTFYGEVIVRSDDSSIRTVRDLKGKKGWIVGFKSAGGYLFQRGLALSNGIDLEEDCFLTESPGNKQEGVIEAVGSGKADFGCVREGMRQKFAGQIDVSGVRVLAKTARYPGWVMSARRDVDANTRGRIEEAFLSLPPDMLTEARLPGGVQSFAPAADRDFDEVRDLASMLGMGY